MIGARRAYSVQHWIETVIFWLYSWTTVPLFELNSQSPQIQGIAEKTSEVQVRAAVTGKYKAIDATFSRPRLNFLSCCDWMIVKEQTSCQTVSRMAIQLLFVVVSSLPSVHVSKLVVT